MPVIKSARKKLRQDKKRTFRNKDFKVVFQKLVKKARKSPTEENIKKAVKIIDKSSKKGIIHKNKAARIKSSLSKLLSKKSESKKRAVQKTATKKTVSKKPYSSSKN